MAHTHALTPEAKAMAVRFELPLTPLVGGYMAVSQAVAGAVPKPV